MDQREGIDHIIRQVSAWTGVAAHPHRFGGTQFNLGRVEVGHIHAPSGMVDIPFTTTTRDRLIAEQLAEVHHLLADSGWISFYLGRTGDAESALRLYRLSYLQKRRHRDKSFAEVDYRAAMVQAGFAAWLGAAESRNADDAG